MLPLAEEEGLVWDLVDSEESFCFFGDTELELEDLDAEADELLESFEDLFDVFLAEDDTSEPCLPFLSPESCLWEEEPSSTAASSMSSLISSTVTKSSKLKFSSSKGSEETTPA